MNGYLFTCIHDFKVPRADAHLPHFCLVLLITFILAGCTTGTELTPITSTPTGQYRPGQVVWHDLLTDDVEGAKLFYGRLFGWSFQEHNNYTLVLNKNEPIAGIIHNSSVKEGPRRACWVTCISAADVNDQVKGIEKIGGKVIQVPEEIANRGSYCIVSDPKGAPLVLLRSASGDPDQVEPRMNGWMWDELWTSDPNAVLSFYKRLGDYSAQQVNPEEHGEPYWILVKNDKWQAGVTTIPFEDVPPQWVPVIRVVDPIAVADRAGTLGGKVLLKPDRSENDEDVALIKDPSGAIFMVQAWQPDQYPGKEE